MKFREDLLTAPTGDGGGNGPRLKLKDGETATGIFAGNFHIFYQNWPKGGVKHASDEPFPGGQMRFEINFVVKEGNSYTPKIFEGGLRVYKQLAALHDEYGLDSTVFKITRSGVEKQTTYTFMPAKQAPSPETLKLLKTLDLIPLGRKSVPNLAPQTSTSEEF
jgi:hypothetical protein